MFILSKKKIYVLLALLILLILAIQIKPIKNENIKETVALPVNKKVIILDSGHGRRRSVGQLLEIYQKQI